MKAFYITAWFILLLAWFGMVGYYRYQMFNQNKFIMAKLEHLEAVKTCAPLDMTNDFGTEMVKRDN